MAKSWLHRAHCYKLLLYTRNRHGVRESRAWKRSKFLLTKMWHRNRLTCCYYGLSTPDKTCTSHQNVPTSQVSLISLCLASEVCTCRLFLQKIASSVSVLSYVCINRKDISQMYPCFLQEISFHRITLKMSTTSNSGLTRVHPYIFSKLRVQIVWAKMIGYGPVRQ